MKNYAFKTILFSIVLLLLTNRLSAQTDLEKDMAKTTYGRNEKAGHTVSMRNFKMYYEVYGQGEPLLFIHGNGGSINNFLYNIPYFSKKYKVIIADSRSQGKSVDKDDSLSYEMMADDLNALLDTLRLDSCYVIGWSDGGINGLLLAMRHPEKVKKLAVTGANLWPDTTAVDPVVYHWAEYVNDSLSRVVQTPEVINQRKLFHLLINEPHLTVEQLHTIKCPSLIIGGDHDILLPKHTMLIAESIPKSYLWILPNSGHSTPVFYKDIFNKTVDDFFAKPYRVIKGEGRFY
jgi:pimeloyl-ACP methyl ester carboxylesterase